MPKVALSKFHMPKFQLTKFHMPKVLYAEIPIAKIHWSLNFHIQFLSQSLSFNPKIEFMQHKLTDSTEYLFMNALSSEVALN